MRRSIPLFLLVLMQTPMSFFFFLKDPAPTEISPLPLHDALPIWTVSRRKLSSRGAPVGRDASTMRRWVVGMSTPRASPGSLHPPAGQSVGAPSHPEVRGRSEEHTSELQSPCNLVCRLLLEKKKKS